jgi:L-threonylcarbamoyladenylate synthase
MKTDKIHPHTKVFGVGIKKAAKILNSGGVVAFPTEPVYGIGAVLDHKKAVERIFKIKKRAKNKPLQVLVSSFEQAKELGKFTERSLEFARNSWPGPFTLVIYKTRRVPKIVTGGSPKVGIRMPDHEVVLELIKKCGPIVASSANKSGEKPALNAKEVKKCLPDIDYVIAGGSAKLGKASAVVDVSHNKTKILRK